MRVLLSLYVYALIEFHILTCLHMLSSLQILVMKMGVAPKYVQTLQEASIVNYITSSSITVQFKSSVTTGFELNSDGATCNGEYY